MESRANRHHYIVGQVYPRDHCFEHYEKDGAVKDLSDNIPEERLSKMDLSGIPLSIGHPPINKKIKDARYLVNGRVKSSFMDDRGNLMALSSLDTSTEHGKRILSSVKRGEKVGLSLGHVYESEFKGGKRMDKYIPDHLGIVERPRREGCFVFDFFTDQELPNPLARSHISNLTSAIDNLPRTTTVTVHAGETPGETYQEITTTMQTCSLGDFDVSKPPSPSNMSTTQSPNPPIELPANSPSLQLNLIPRAAPPSTDYIEDATFDSIVDFLKNPGKKETLLYNSRVNRTVHQLLTGEFNSENSSAQNTPLRKTSSNSMELQQSSQQMSADQPPQQGTKMQIDPSPSQQQQQQQQTKHPPPEKSASTSSTEQTPNTDDNEKIRRTFASLTPEEQLAAVTKLIENAREESQNKIDLQRKLEKFEAEKKAAEKRESEEVDTQLKSAIQDIWARTGTAETGDKAKVDDFTGALADLPLPAKRKVGQFMGTIHSRLSNTQQVQVASFQDGSRQLEHNQKMMMGGSLNQSVFASGRENTLLDLARPQQNSGASAQSFVDQFAFSRGSLVPLNDSAASFDFGGYGQSAPAPKRQKTMQCVDHGGANVNMDDGFFD